MSFTSVWRSQGSVSQQNAEGFNSGVCRLAPARGAAPQEPAGLRAKGYCHTGVIECLSNDVQEATAGSWNTVTLDQILRRKLV